jgi:hypothetical protein
MASVSWEAFDGLVRLGDRLAAPARKATGILGATTVGVKIRLGSATAMAAGCDLRSSAPCDLG